MTKHSGTVISEKSKKSEVLEAYKRLLKEVEENKVVPSQEKKAKTGRKKTYISNSRAFLRRNC